MKVKCLRYLILVLFLCFAAGWIFVPGARAQNFSNFVPANQEPEDVLTEAEVQKILKNEGIIGVENENGNDISKNIDSIVDQIDPQAAQPEVSKYTLGINDVIEITVQRHPEVSGKYMINTEGKVQYEFIGDVVLSGYTKEEAVDILRDKLSKYIISPEVNVKILEYNSKVVYVIGEVGRPGKIFMRGDTITVREALIQAGLPLLTAKAQKSMLITPSSDGKPKQHRVNIYDLLYEGDLRQNLVMKPGDTLYIPPTLMAKALRVIQPVAAPISTAAGAGRQVMTGGF